MNLTEAMNNEEAGKSLALLVSGYAVFAEVFTDLDGKHVQLHIDSYFKKSNSTCVILHQNDMEKLIDLYTERKVVVLKEGTEEVYVKGRGLVLAVDRREYTEAFHHGIRVIHKGEEYTVTSVEMSGIGDHVSPHLSLVVRKKEEDSNE